MVAVVKRKSPRLCAKSFRILRMRSKSFRAVPSTRSRRYASLMRAEKDPRGPSGRKISSTVFLSGRKAARIHASSASSSHAAATKAVPRSACFVKRAIAFLSEPTSGGVFLFFAIINNCGQTRLLRAPTESHPPWTLRK